MKKIVFIFAMALIAISCDPAKWMDTHRTYWYVKNSTDQTLIMTTSPFIDTDVVINPEDSALIHVFNPLQYLGLPSFDIFYDAWERNPEQERCISIYSQDEHLLKSWTYTDRNAAGRQLFNESFWRLYIKKSEQYAEQTYTWVFDIFAEDIAPL